MYKLLHFFSLKLTHIRRNIIEYQYNSTLFKNLKKYNKIGIKYNEWLGYKQSL